MVYCKWCGMDSRQDRKCEWCGKDLAAAPVSAPPPVRDYVAEFEDDNRSQRITFYISCIAMVGIATGLLAWRFLLYPYVALSALFIAGILLGALRILPAMEDEWHEFVLPAVLILLLGPEIVFVGYLTYGLITRAMDLTVIWLLSVYFILLLLIEVMAVMLVLTGHGPETLPVTFYYLQMRGAAILGLPAIAFGWGASSIFRPLNK